MRNRAFSTTLALALTSSWLLGCNGGEDGDGGGGGSRDASSGDAATPGTMMDGAVRDSAMPGPDGAKQQPEGDAAMREDGGPGEDDCPEGAPGTPPSDYLLEFGSGTRLQATYWSAEGMPDIFTGFFDTELGVACDFMRASDGELRCLPRDAVRAVHLGYIDDQCRRSAYETSTVCGTQDGYVRMQTGCRETYEVAKLEPLAGSSSRYFKQDETCQDSGETIEPSAETFAMGDPIAPSTFVRGTLRALPSVCRAGLRIVEADDGAFGPHEVFDVARGLTCGRSAGTGQSPCNPSRRGFVEEGLYTDAACTEQAPFGTWFEAPECGQPDLIRARPDDDVDYYEVGGVREDPVYASIGGCEPAQDKPWIGTVFELGNGVLSSELAQFEQLTRGSARLQAHVMAEGTTPLIAGVAGGDLAFFDTTLEEECTVFLFADGVRRCVPLLVFSPVAVEQQFNDAACTQPIRRCSGDDCVGRLLLDRELDPSACDTEARVSAAWIVREPATGYYRDYGAGCVEGGEVGPDQWLVDAVDVTMYATVEAHAAE